jgi:broad specificity phosphatase PhoE
MRSNVEAGMTRVLPPLEPGTSQTVVLRHGHSLANKLGLIAGITDVPLSKLGRKEAKIARQRVAPFGPFDNVYSSTMVRASETAYTATRIRPEQTPLLGERNFGDAELTYVTPKLIDFLANTPLKERYDMQFADKSETDRDIMNRWKKLFNQKGHQLRGRRNLFGTHSSTMQTVMSAIGFEKLLVDFGLPTDSDIGRIHNTAFFVVQGTGKPRTPDLEIVYSSGIDFKKSIAA